MLLFIAIRFKIITLYSLIIDLKNSILIMNNKHHYLCPETQFIKLLQY